MMNKIKDRKYVVFVVLSTMALLATGCRMPGAATPMSQDAVYTVAAQTLIAEFTLSAPAPILESTATSTQAPQELPTDTLPPFPTDTSTPEYTPTMVFTPTSEVPLISASTNTNCRRGPNRLYDPPVGTLNVGMQVQVFGRNAESTWWYIQNPQNKSQYCWVWAETTQVIGNTAGLPIITPPPLPPTATFTATPGAVFKASFEKIRTCSGEPTAIFTIDNRGTAALESLSLRITDTTDGTVIYGPSVSNAPFMATASECPPGGDVLPKGTIMYVGGELSSAISGHSGRAVIKLCTKDDLDGLCESKTVDFTLP